MQPQWTKLDAMAISKAQIGFFSSKGVRVYAHGEITTVIAEFCQERI